MGSLSHAFSNEQEEVEQGGLPIQSWLSQGEVKDVKVEKYKIIPSNWACDLERGECIVKDNPANEKDVFKNVKDCIKKTRCNGFIKKDAKETPAKATRGRRVTRAKATRTTDGNGHEAKATRGRRVTRAKATRTTDGNGHEAKATVILKARSKKSKSKKRKQRRNKSKKEKKQTRKKSKK